MRHTFCATYRDISIRPLHEEDIELLRQWRNNKDLSKFLTPMDEITPDMQKKWYESYLTDDDCIFFVVIDREQKKVIGTVAIYDFCGGVAEVGKIVIGDDSMRGKGIGYTSLLLAMCVGFNELCINSCKLRVFEENTVALNLYKKTGFHETGRNNFEGNMTELAMEISRDVFFDINKIGEEIIVYKECNDETAQTFGKNGLESNGGY